MVTVPAHNFWAPTRAKMIAVGLIVGTRHRDAFLEILLAKAIENRGHKPDRNRNFRRMGDLSGQDITDRRRVPMGATEDKIKGATNEAIGKAKQGIGEATGSDRLKGEGVIQEVKGKGQKAVGDAKEATKDAVNKAAAAANKNL